MESQSPEELRANLEEYTAQKQQVLPCPLRATRPDACSLQPLQTLRATEPQHVLRRMHAIEVSA